MAGVAQQARRHVLVHLHAVVQRFRAGLRGQDQVDRLQHIGQRKFVPLHPHLARLYQPGHVADFGQQRLLQLLGRAAGRLEPLFGQLGVDGVASGVPAAQ
ncbi:hypothetical protein G6F24_017613 [Rhizopus arrhizus]|nr:hypothetical protein G6F24_017613 [Rhizopus arrhizus]